MHHKHQILSFVLPKNRLIINNSHFQSQGIDKWTEREEEGSSMDVKVWFGSQG